VGPVAAEVMYTSRFQYQLDRYFAIVQAMVDREVATLAVNKDKLDVIQYSGGQHQEPVIV
jgi:hypothetical protein